jgi:flagellar motor switch protein FliG
MKKRQPAEYFRDHDLTIEEVKACAIFKHLSDAEAEEVIATLKTFTKIVYDCYKKEQQKF